MKDYSEPAFPIVGGCADNQFNGMTLRDYFAGKAVVAIMGNTQTMISLSKSKIANGDGLGARIAAAAYEVADAMLVERAK